MVALALGGAIVSGSVRADLDEGMAAYTRGDFFSAAKEFRTLAIQGYSEAQYCLGLMYANGLGVDVSRVVAYALFTLSAASNPSAANNSTVNREELAGLMSKKEIEAARNLTQEMRKPRGFLKALDNATVRVNE